MGNPFRLKWDDFSGGYYVGQTEARQPQNTFTGYNANVASHDGSAVPANQVWQAKLVAATISGVTVANDSVHIDNSSGTPLILKDTVLAAGRAHTLLLRINGGNVEAKAITIAFDADASDSRNLATLNQSVYSPAWTVLFAAGSFTASDLVAFGPDAYFVVNGDVFKIDVTGVITSVAASTSAQPGKMAVYGSRMVSAQTNTLTFSNFNNPAVWPTLNFITVGSYLVQTLALIPRYDDLLWVRSDGVYSIYGTLGFNAAVRRISDALDINSLTGNVAGKDNAMYYIEKSLEPYVANIKMLYGNQTNTIAYQNMGISLNSDGNKYASRPMLTTTNTNCLVAMWPQVGTGNAGFEALIRKSDKRYVRLRQAPLTFNPGSLTSADYSLRYAAINDLNNDPGFWYNNVFVVQYATNYVPNFLGNWELKRLSLSFGIWQPEQTNAGFLPGPPSGAGSTSTTNTATPGLIELPPIETEVPSKVRRVYVEAELNLDWYLLDDFRGTAYIKAYVENRSVDDMSFVDGVNFTSSQMLTSIDLTTVNSLTSQAINGPWKPTTPYPSTDSKKRASMTRVLRFDPNDTGYGYKHNIMFEFQGFRIKRAWVEGDTR